MVTRLSLSPHLHQSVPTLAPGPSPRSSQSLYPTVLNVPADDYDAFMREVVSRYEHTLMTFWPKAVLRSAAAPHPRRVSDARLAEIVWHTAAAAMVTRTIDPGAAEAFAPLLEASPQTPWLVCDLTCIGEARGELLPGLHAAPTRILLEETEGDPVVRAIEVDRALFRPTDLAWELASLFARQGLSHAVIMASHPRNHFPYDTVNAVSRRLLPAGHLVRELLEPHCYIHLALNYGVLYSERSVARNDQRNLYAPFCTTERGQFQITRAGWKGIPGSAVWAPYRYPLEPYRAVGPFGDFCRHYDAVIRAHVRRVLADFDPSDHHVARWADEISGHIPGFPDAARVGEPGVLADAVTTMIVGVSVVHSSEHYTYAQVDVDEVPLRLRIPPPVDADAGSFRYEDLTTRRDVFRQQLAHEMFFKVHPVRRLADVQLSRCDAKLAGAGERLRRELREASARLPGREYVPLSMIAASLQY